MKFGLVLLVSSLSSGAFACPALQGAWACTSPQNGDSTLTISETSIPGGVLYKMDDGSEVADVSVDGLQRVESTPDLIEKSTYWCNGTTGFEGILSTEPTDHSFISGGTVKVDLTTPTTFEYRRQAVIRVPGDPDIVDELSIDCTKQ